MNIYPFALDCKSAYVIVRGVPIAFDEFILCTRAQQQTQRDARHLREIVPVVIVEACEGCLLSFSRHRL
jgi:hypothetical protein